MSTYNVLLVLIVCVWEQVTCSPLVRVTWMEQNILLHFLFLKRPHKAAKFLNHITFSFSLKSESSQSSYLLQKPIPQMYVSDSIYRDVITPVNLKPVLVCVCDSKYSDQFWHDSATQPEGAGKIKEWNKIRENKIRKLRRRKEEKVGI